MSLPFEYGGTLLTSALRPGPGGRLSVLVLAVFLATGNDVVAQSDDSASQLDLNWRQLPDLPERLGVAGPFVGVHGPALIVAGGANFPEPIWDDATQKQWHDRIHVLLRSEGEYEWIDGGVLERPLGYGAAVSTPEGVVCMGGNDANEHFAGLFLARLGRN